MPYLTVNENKDFEGLIKRYCRKKVLLNLDPPYYQAEKYYDSEFKEEDHIRLNNCLAGTKGRFVLSYNNIVSSFINYSIIETVRQHNLIAKSGSEKYKELIIENLVNKCLIDIMSLRNCVLSPPIFQQYA